MKFKQFRFIMLLSVFGFTPMKNLQAQYNEKYRPQFHFSPKKGWIGDPDGLVYSQGLYHLFWWGHAISKDLIHWEEQPYPMLGSDKSFSYFSGSVVVDKDNTSGFGANSMIAIYTMHKRGDSLPETQGLSVSSDRINFDFYKGNPVLDIRKVFFRDPQVFWHEPTKKWVMAITVPDRHKIHFYSSRNLKEWIYMSEFGDLGPRSSFWECPDLFELDVDGDPAHKKWVLLIGQGPNRVHYFMGSFDGREFKADETTVAYLNEGRGIPGHVFDSFEDGNFARWKKSGKAFGNKPDISDSIVRIGKGDATSSWGSDSLKGSLISTSFVINKNAINFLIAGGNHSGQTCINLLVNNKIVRTATGSNNSLLKWDGWDVSDIKGQNATLQILDAYSGLDWGHIRIDHIMFSDVVQQQQLQHALWLDYGTDFYATRSYRFLDSVKAKPVFLGWLGNWEYARNAPSEWGKGFESLPREIALKKLPEGIRLVQAPIEGLKTLRKDSAVIKNRTISGTTELQEFKPSRNTYEIEASFKTDGNSVFGFNLLVGEGRKLVISYNPKTSSLCIDRSNCTDFISNDEFTKKFATKMYAPVEAEGNLLKLRILVDQASVEVFTNQGKMVLSAVTYPSPLQTGIQLFSEKGNTQLVNLKGWELSSIWPTANSTTKNP